MIIREVVLQSLRRLPLVAVLFLTPSAFSGQSVTLAWDPNPDANLASYRLYYGNASRSYSASLTVNKSIPAATLTDLIEGQTYFFAVTALTSEGLESEYSEEISYRVPATTINAAPLALGGSVQTAEDQSVGIVLQGTDPEGDPLTYTVVGAPIRGNLTGTPPNLTYWPGANLYGNDAVTFVVSDGKASSAAATVAITINPINDLPTLNPIGSLSIYEDSGPQVVTFSGIGSGAANEDQPLSISVVSGDPAHVYVANVTYASPNTSGTVVLNLATNANGPVAIWVSVSDGQNENRALIRWFTVAVHPLPDAPIAKSDSFATTSGVPLTVTASQLLANDTDPDAGDVATVVSANPSSTVGGVVSFAAGVLTYTPPSGFTGRDTFTYTVRDLSGLTASGQVQVNVTAPIDPSGVLRLNIAGPPVVLRFQAAANMPYTVEYKDNLDPGPWMTLQSVPPGIIREVTVNDTSPGQARFYRVRNQ